MKIVRRIFKLLEPTIDSPPDMGTVFDFQAVAQYRIWFIELSSDINVIGEGWKRTRWKESSNWSYK